MYTISAELKSESMYYQLVSESKDRSDIEGMIAYALYKADKIRYIEEQKGTDGGVKPNHEKLLNYQKLKCNEIHNSDYLDVAKDLLFETANTLIEDKVIIIQKKEKELNSLLVSNKELEVKRKRLLQEIRKDEKELASRKKYCKAVKKHGFWFGVLQSIIASIFILIITIVIALGLNSKYNLIDTINTSNDSSLNNFTYDCIEL